MHRENIKKNCSPFPYIQIKHSPCAVRKCMVEEEEIFLSHMENFHFPPDNSASFVELTDYRGQTEISPLFIKRQTTHVIYYIHIYIKKRLTFVPVPADSVHHSGGSLEYWLSVQPTNRISSHYSAHVFSGQPISRIDTIGDNGKHPPAYPPAAGGHRAPR